MAQGGHDRTRELLFGRAHAPPLADGSLRRHRYLNRVPKTIARAIALATTRQKLEMDCSNAKEDSSGSILFFFPKITGTITGTKAGARGKRIHPSSSPHSGVQSTTQQLKWRSSTAISIFWPATTSALTKICVTSAVGSHLTVHPLYCQVYRKILVFWFIWFLIAGLFVRSAVRSTISKTTFSRARCF